MFGSVEKLAEIAGVPLKIKNKKEIEKFEKNKIFFQIYKKVAEVYQEQLFNNIGKNALKYVLSRGIKLEIIKQYNLGFSPKDPSIIINTLKKEFSENDLFESGVINKKNNFVYDPFYGRLIFPIKNKSGEYIGFGGGELSKFFKHLLSRRWYFIELIKEIYYNQKWMT